ncbi:ABC transporter permease [Pyxidicoccus sp. MSG2]|uniref:ABC transporter permease n=1 Tax=Pyxidicoccus sp. MSG2 TaxID=2996790 RepID=UPI002271CBFA|nr:ABC transporter permease [Pyxidicoccus sp. MSG2]MCY1016175.1 ABC transporter permease [Pyxidicoccus sp. MSG2]
MTLGLLALQSIRSRPRSWIVGLLAAGAAAVLTVGVALVASIHDGTRRTLIESGAGHLQVYDARSPESPLLVFGPNGPPTLEPFADYPAVEALVRGVEGVREVVPLEVNRATVFRGNYLDEMLAALRAVVREPPSPERDARLARRAEDLEATLRRVAREAARHADAFTVGAEHEEDRRALESVLAPGFQQRFLAEPLPTLELLENRVARQLGEGEAVELDLMGTELPRFAGAFPRVEVVTGQLPPEGSRGLMLGHGAWEQNFKLPIAWRLDEVSRGLARGATLAGDEGLRTLVERNRGDVPELVSRLEQEQATALRAALERVQGHPGALEALLEDFLTLDDATFAPRYAAFYQELAPHLPLYRVKPGDTLVLKGSVEPSPGVPVRVWGTYRFKGLGGDFSRVNITSLVDLVTLRHLTGRPTRAEQEETRRLVASLGLAGASVDASPESLVPPTIEDAPAAPARQDTALTRAEGPPPTFTDEEVRSGSILHAAVVLAPDVPADAVAARIQELATAKGLSLKTVGWEEAGGFVGGVVGMAQVLLLAIAALISFFVLLVATGTLLLLARERVAEVGTLRAVGMHRREVFVVLLAEGLVLGFVGGALGAGLGAALILGGAGGGIPVEDAALQLFLGGPVLVPRLEWAHAVAVVVGVVGVVAGAALLPAWRGSRVAPLVAMRQGGE